MDETKELDSLLEELKENRENLHEMLNDVSEFRKNLDLLLPAKLDYREKYLMQERMKAVTEILRGELAIRGQIDSSIKLEIDIRKRTTDDEFEDLPTQIKIYAKAMEMLENKKKSIIKELPDKLKLVKKEEKDG